MNLKKFLHQTFRLLFFPFRRWIMPSKKSERRGYSRQQKAFQIKMIEDFKSDFKTGSPIKPLHDLRFSLFSQNNEDGILLYIFSLIGTTNKKCVEIGCGFGTENNTSNLIIHHDWYGLLIDAGQKQIEHAKGFFNSEIKNRKNLPVLVHAHITRENINTIIEDHGFSGDIDLLSIDIDGVDYWIWKELDACRPRVVVTEVQCIWGSRRMVTVPYHPHFEPGFVDGYGIYSGASLAAFNKLAVQKGYRFIGIENKGYNAFFLRNDIAPELFPETDLSIIDEQTFVIWAKKKFYHLIENKKWIEV